MNYDLLNHQIEFLIYYLVYKKGEELYEFPFTRIDTIRPKNFSKSTTEHLYAFNLATDQYETVPWRNIIYNSVKQISTDVLKKGRAGTLTQDEIDIYINENLSLIKINKERATTAREIEKQYIENLDYTSLKEHNNVFYKITGFTNKADLTNKILDRAFHEYFIYTGTKTKQQALLNRIFAGIDINDLALLRAKWYDLIQIYKKKAIRQLQAELKDAKEENNTEDVEEINIILNIVHEIDKDVKNDLNSIDSYTNLVRYWPPILLPAPRFVE